jgi:hypothetical protein
MKKLLLLLLLQGCTIFEPLEGLCYTDKEGTYICPCDKDHPLACEIEDIVDDYVRIKIEDMFP